MKFACLILIFFLMHQKLLLSQDSSLVVHKRLFTIEEINPNELLPENALSLEIFFINKDNPLKKGWWIFSEDQLLVSITLTNHLDSVIYVPPISDLNPIFTIEGKKKECKTIPKVIDFTPSIFQKIEPRSIYKDTINILTKVENCLIEGKDYSIFATFFSRWAAFKDSKGKMHRIWAGRITSNVLKFTFHD